jgi:hypothetical protein
MFRALTCGGICLMLALVVGWSGPVAPSGSGQPRAPAAGARAAPPVEEKPVRESVQRFYDTFNSHDWVRVAEFTTEDWTHIDRAAGGREGGRRCSSCSRESTPPS